jgi:hypothetical protein
MWEILGVVKVVVVTVEEEDGDILWLDQVMVFVLLSFVTMKNLQLQHKVFSQCPLLHIQSTKYIYTKTSKLYLMIFGIKWVPYFYMYAK